MSCLSITLTTPVILAFSDWQAHPPLLETWLQGEVKTRVNWTCMGGDWVTTNGTDTYPSLQSELSETPITAPSLPARPSLATDSGGQCLAGSPPQLLYLALPALNLPP